MEVRQISNRKNKICLRVGIGMCIISAIEMLLIKFYFKSKWTGRNVDLFFLFTNIRYDGKDYRAYKRPFHPVL